MHVLPLGREEFYPPHTRCQQDADRECVWPAHGRVEQKVQFLTGQHQTFANRWSGAQQSTDHDAHAGVGVDEAL